MMPVPFLLTIPSAAPSAGLPKIIRSAEPPHQADTTLWLDPDTPCLALGRTGLIIGVLFSRTSFNRVIDASDFRFDFDSAEEAAAYLLANFWGAYFAILTNGDHRGLATLVDPSGLLPVFVGPMSDRLVLTSDAAMLGAPISYRELASHLQRPEMRQRATCFEGVCECTPGALTHLSQPGLPERQLWDATSFLPRNEITFAEAVEELRLLSIKVHAAWGEFFGQVCVASSGGVDSSLVCASLAAAGVPFGCITLATRDQSGDERGHARSVADRLGVRCLEREFSRNDFDHQISASYGLPRPSRRLFVAAIDSLLDDSRRELGASVVFDGTNGDNLFCYLHSAAPVVDRLRAHGLRLGTFATLLDMCRITDCSVSTILGAASRRLLGKGNIDPWPADTSLLTVDATAVGHRPLTPWLEGWTASRSGHLDHLKLMMHAQNHIHGLTATQRRFSPLASQPFVEFCLGIPSWQWARGGVNRAPARAAFADLLPPAILARTSKAGPDSFVRTAFAATRSQIRERLLGGLLVSKGLLDACALDRAIAVDEARDAFIVDRILDFLEAENWARSWVT